MDLGINGSRKRRRASTVTLGSAPSIRKSEDDGDYEVEVGTTAGTPVSPTTPQRSTNRTKFIVGLDYGTTFSSVSYIKFAADNPPKTLHGEQIKSVSGWPNTMNLWRNPDVPSESWYLDDDYFWGYNAREKVKGIEDGQLESRNKIIQFAKLLLKDSERGVRDELRRTLHRTRKDEKGVIKDYLREILKHSKNYLQKKERFNEDCEVELVFCVPAGWTAKAIRTMQEILLDIAREINFGILSPLFILNEPEAAAAYILEALSGGRDLAKGDVFIVCDAGGGTVDTITYQVRRERPFRVDEVVAPAGMNCGSSYVNQALKTEVIRRIKDTEYVALKGPSFEYIIEHDIMNYVEYSLKRNFDPADGLDGEEGIVVHGLKEDSRKGFGDSILRMSRRDIAGFFRFSLDGITKLIRQQTAAVDEKGLTVSKILLVGGFSTSPVLISHIERKFPNLGIIDSTVDMATVVSHGAVFRALNKEDGPRRVVQSNFGFLQLEEYNQKLPGHQAAGSTYNLINGKRYVFHVLDWVIKRNRVLKKREPFRTRNYQTFPVGEELVIRQEVWVSDAARAQDNYHYQHRVNRGAEKFGRLEVDLQKVKDEGLLVTKSGPKGDFFEIHYELGMEVDGRNLTVKLFCPPGGKCRGQTQLCIAAAFIPGTE